MEKSLRESATKGILWNAIEKLSNQFFQFAISIALARLLIPSDFGLIGMITVFIAISTTFVNSGMSSGLIQKQAKEDIDFSTVFVFNATVSLLFYVLLYLAAPYIASFYETPELVSITRVIGINIVIASLAVVQRARLTIDLDFKTLAKVNVASVVVSGVIAIYLAYTGFGVWSLVYKQIIAAVIGVILLWYYSRWKPSLSFSKSSFDQLFGFGSKLLISGIYSKIFQNVNNILIGKYYTTKDLGDFTQARSISEIASGTVSSVLEQVTYPLLSKLKEDKGKMVDVFKQLIRISAFVIFPTMICLAVLAKPFVHVLLGEKWLDIVPFLQLMCFARIFYPLSVLNLNLLNANGRSDLFLKVDLSKAPLILIALAISIPYGVKAMVLANVLVAAISFLINAYMPGRLFGFGPIHQLKVVFPTMLSSSLMGILVLVSIHYLESNILKILVGASVGIVAYLSVSYFVSRKEVMELQIFVKRLKGMLLRHE